MTINDESKRLEGRDTVELEREFLEQPGILRIRIMGINALGILHRHAMDLLAILRNGGTVEVLLLDPESAEFRRHRDRQEKSGGKVSNRILAETEASLAILRDILNQLLHRYDLNVIDVSSRFSIRFYDRRADVSLLFVETPKQKALLHRKIPLRMSLPGRPTHSHLVSARSDRKASAYLAQKALFEDCWRAAKVVSLENLSSDIEIVSPRSSDAAHLYAQATELHKKRRLDEASVLYRTVLKLAKPHEPSAQQVHLARRFMPRVFTTRLEPFELKDFVAVLHPKKSKRLIGYHLIWEDDIDYLNDNDPADHEIVWVKYGIDYSLVEQAWSNTHGSILSTDRAVADANVHNQRVKVNVQWGKHASLLEGWEDKIGVDHHVSGHPDFEPLQFSRLSEGRNPVESHYSERWPKRFKGKLNDFTQFPVEIDMQAKFEEHKMVAVSCYPNAVISEWFLPYNVYPKAGWPC